MTHRRVDTVVIGALTLPVSDPRLQAALTLRNENNDSVVDASDILLPPGVKSAAYDAKNFRDIFLRRTVAAAFVEAGLISSDQQDALETFFSVYNTAKRFSDAVVSWEEHGRAGGPNWRRFRLDEAYCQRTPYPTIPGNGEFVTTNLTKLATDIHSSIHTLSGEGPEETVDIVWKGQACGSSRQTPYMTGFQYDERNIPDVLRASVTQVSKWYVDGARWLFSFDSANCGDPTKNPADVSSNDYRGTNVLWWIGADMKNEHYTQTFSAVCEEHGLY